MLPASIGTDVHKLTGHEVRRDGGSPLHVGEGPERYLVGQDLLKPGEEGGVQGLGFSPEMSRKVQCSSLNWLKRRDSIMFPSRINGRLDDQASTKPQARRANFKL